MTIYGLFNMASTLKIYNIAKNFKIQKCKFYFSPTFTF